MSVFTQSHWVEAFLQERLETQENINNKKVQFVQSGLEDQDLDQQLHEQLALVMPAQKLAKRVLICSDVAPYRNGVGAYYADLMDDLKSHVAQVEILCPRGDSGWRGGLNIPLPGDTTQKVPLPNIVKLARRIERYRPDVVVVGTQGAYGIVGACVGHEIGARVIAGYHTCFTQLVSLYWDRLRTLGVRTACKASNRYIFNYADEVLANSPEMIRLAQQGGAKQAQLIGTPVTPRYLTTPVRRVPKAIKKVLFVGRLAAEKHIDAVVAAALAMPKLSFSVVGEGPERARLTKVAAAIPNLNLLGWVDRLQMDRVMDAHDALVLPSKVESFGTVALEAMARQRIVVVSQACGIQSWSCLRAGLTVMQPDESLAQVLMRLSQLRDFDLFSKGARARAAVRQHVLWNRQLWLAALGRPSPRPVKRLGRLSGLKTCGLLAGLW